MIIEIPDEMAERIGIIGMTEEQVTIELTDLADRIPVEVTGSKFTEGVVIYAKKDR